MGASLHKAARKWGAYIRRGGVRQYLGLFDTAEEAHAAYVQADAEYRREHGESGFVAPTRDELLQRVRELYAAHGIAALSTTFLEKQKGRLYHWSLATDLKQPKLLKTLGLADEYAEWRRTARKYRAVVKPLWSWEVAIETAMVLKTQEGDLPTVEWCRRNGYASLTSAVHKSGHTWDDLRRATGSPPASTFHESRNGLRWRSRPEASLSNFLYARGIAHRHGERYEEGYTAQSGRKWGQMDVHFRTPSGRWIDVEIWGDELNGLSRGRYMQTRAYKEKFHASNSNFLGIPYKDCLSDERLTKILEPYIGIIAPHRFDKPSDKLIQTSHWSDADDLLKTCAALAAQMPDGKFPAESWLRKRGKYKGRPGPAYNTIAVRVNQWLGGTRKVRTLLGQGHANTIEWNLERAISEWRHFHESYGLTPSQCMGKSRRASMPPQVVTTAARIYEGARRYGFLAAVRNAL